MLKLILNKMRIEVKAAILVLIILVGYGLKVFFPEVLVELIMFCLIMLPLVVFILDKLETEKSKNPKRTPYDPYDQVYYGKGHKYDFVENKYAKKGKDNDS
jgi:hypothetical protein